MTLRYVRLARVRPVHWMVVKKKGLGPVSAAHPNADIRPQLFHRGTCDCAVGAGA